MSAELSQQIDWAGLIGTFSFAVTAVLANARFRIGQTITASGMDQRLRCAAHTISTPQFLSYYGHRHM